MSAATFLPPSLVVDNLSVENSLSVTENVSVGDSVTVANLVSAGSVASASTISAVGISAGNVQALAVNGGTCDFSGAAEFGSSGADTFKAHGATAQSGLQSAFVAQLGAFTDPPTAPEMAALRTAVNALLTCEIDHGFMAPA